MEIDLRFDEVMGAHQALSRILDKEFKSVVMAVRVGDALRRLQPVFENLAKEHDALLERHAKRDEDGAIKYKNENKTQIDAADTLDDALNEFFGGTIQVSLPKLEAAGCALSEGQLVMADVAPICFLFDKGWEAIDAPLSRQGVMDTLQAFDGLLSESFESSALVKIAQARNALLGGAREILIGRREIIQWNAPRGDDGEILYSDKEAKIVAESQELQDAVDAYMKETVIVPMPPLRAEDFSLPDGKGLSARRMYGLVPVLSIVT